jgi:hypothetical protein
MNPIRTKISAALLWLSHLGGVYLFVYSIVSDRVVVFIAAIILLGFTLAIHCCAHITMKLVANSMDYIRYKEAQNKQESTK